MVRVGGSAAARQGGGDLKIPKGNCKILADWSSANLSSTPGTLAKQGAADLRAYANAADL